MKDDTAKPTTEATDPRGRTKARPGQEETSALADASRRATTLLHPRLDLLGRPIHASRSVLGRWDAKALLLLASDPGFDRDDFVWVGPERLGHDTFCVSIYTGLAADSPSLRITQGDCSPDSFRVCLYLGGADGEEGEEPFLTSECAAADLAAHALRLIAAARCLGMSGRMLIFKHEAEVGGEPIGPAVLAQVSDGRGDRQMVGVPFVPKCVCDRPAGSPGERCGRCGDEIPESWVTLSQARARARELGVELRET